MAAMKKKWSLENFPFSFAFLLCFVFIDGSKTKQGKYSETYCTFQDTKYRAGERWHPHLEPHGTHYCIGCLCSETGNVLCHRIKCPKLHCRNLMFSSQLCCPWCRDEPVASKGSRATGKSCAYNGTTYQHGEMFVVEGLFQSRQANQCEQCSCSEGNVYCALKTCPRVTCPSPVSLPDSCCRVCKGGGESTDSVDGDLIHQPANREARHSPPHFESPADSSRPSTTIPQSPRNRSSQVSLLDMQQASDTIVQIVLSNRTKLGQVCISHGKTYSHGESWHPYLWFHGIMECVLCTCNVTSQECKRIDCPHQYPCKEPKKIEGKCCKICPEEVERQHSEDKDYFCGEETLPVYEATFTTERETIQKIAFERNGASEVEIHVWTVKKGVSSHFDIKRVTKEKFRELLLFKQITSTTLGQWKIFSEGEEHIRQACENRDCGTELQDLVKILHLEKSDKDPC